MSHKKTEELGPTRRAVLAGAAWGLPVVALAVAAPAASASNEPVGRVSFVSSSNVGPGHLYWRYDATNLTNSNAIMSVTFSNLGDITIAGWSNRGAWSLSDTTFSTIDPVPAGINAGSNLLSLLGPVGASRVVTATVFVAGVSGSTSFPFTITLP